MANLSMLRDKIVETGMTLQQVADLCGFTRMTLYNKLKGRTKITANDIAKFTKVLKLNRAERDKIFFS